MKYKTLLISALLSAVTCAEATPTPVNITVSGGAIVVASSDLSSYGDGTVLSWVSSDIPNYNTLAPANYPSGSVALGSKTTTGSSPDSIQLTLTGTDQYLFLHWGGQGSGWAQLFYIGGLTGDYTFASTTIDNGAGHPAVGGLSFYSYYDAKGSTVPDGGSTLWLLGAAMSGLAFAARRFRK